ncbi:Zinc (Zn2)-Iron (Fe2) Permease (ZIP) Family [Achlya hypogyna]|uniref:Zinc (Zn2)-Iron (Fe2) Permease (ZIP) Family n=1 Tax=Achlya hypogyna TaxID=1202772 RepID=A0A1V9YSF2_ACHHY|nr:Zinc (Zn2)-Iron (Fe2) Permease (ZIP) Family [Achlya hypogyna]
MPVVVVNYTCAEPRDLDEDYDMGLHIASAFIIFFCSLAGAMLPVISSYVACLRNNRKTMELMNAFGFGVVISTAFVHMLPPAFHNLDSPCLGLPYKGLAMVIVLATIFSMQLLETELVVAMSVPNTSEATTFEEAPAMLAKDNYDDVGSPLGFPRHGTTTRHQEVAVSAQDEAVLRQKFTVAIFEIGVAIHSVLIGVELGVEDDDAFRMLFIALCFHQFFEGVAVGTSAVSAFSGLKTSLGTAFLYALTTPLGVIVGILAADSYSDTSLTALWVRGVLDAIASGILIYTGLIELITYQYTINTDFHGKSTPRRTAHYIFFYMGASVMAIIGYYT